MAKPRSQNFNVHTDKNVFGAITYCVCSNIIRIGRRSCANRYNRSGGFVVHNPAEQVSTHVTHRELVPRRTKNAANSKCTTDLSGGFSLLHSRNAPPEVAIHRIVSSHHRKRSVCSWACFTAIRAFDLSSVLHVEPDPAVES